jgi:nucleotide-binding universal stress UspA family protein
MTNVLACIDDSTISPAVCDYATWASLRLAAPLQLLHVLDNKEFPKQSDISGQIGLGSREDLLNQLTELDEKRGKIALTQGQALLASAKARVLESGIIEAVSRQRHGDLVDTLIALEDEIRLVVLGKHNPDTVGDHVGNNLERVVRTMHRPILAVPNNFTEPKSLMIAYDGSETTKKAITMVARSPLFSGLPCHVVMVGSATDKMQADLDWAKTELEANQVKVTTAFLSGDVKPALCEYRDTQQIDMLVMGAYGHSKIRQFLVGSTTTKMLQHSSSVPLLLLR